LIELLVVIGIISLLVSILLPSLANARLMMQKLKCATNIRGITHGLIMFEQEMGQLPQRFNAADPQQHWGYDDDLLYEGVLDEREIFICPSHSTHAYYADFKSQPSYGFNWYYDNVKLDRVKHNPTIAIAETNGNNRRGSHRADVLNESPHLLAPERHDGVANYGMFTTTVLDGTLEEMSGPNLVNWGTDQGKHTAGHVWPKGKAAE
jgi:hypothetical protein